MSDRYFEPNYTHDQDAHGNLPPAVEWRGIIVRPIAVKGAGIEIAPVPVSVKAEPDTRIFKTSDPQIAQAMAQCPDLREIDKPSDKVLKQHREQTASYKAANTPTSNPEA